MSKLRKYLWMTLGVIGILSVTAVVFATAVFENFDTYSSWVPTVNKCTYFSSDYVNGFRIVDAMRDTVASTCSGGRVHSAPYAARLRNQSLPDSVTTHAPYIEYISTNTDSAGKDGGVGTFSFWWKKWSTSTGNRFKMSYNSNGAGWVDFDSVNTGVVADTSWYFRTNNLNLAGDNIKIRITNQVNFPNSSSLAAQLDLDDIYIGDYTAPCIPSDATVFHPQPSIGPQNQHQCITICPSEAEHEICVGPVPMPDRVPSVRVIAGCGTNTPCDNPSCIPAVGFVWNPTWVWTQKIDGFYYCAKITWGPAPNTGGCVCVSFDDILPVSLSTFSAQTSTDGIRLNFSVASETNNDLFEIWRSTEADGNFAKIAEIPSQGNSTSGHNYEYVDRTVTVGQTYWYYLANVDLQGNRTEHRDFLRSTTFTGTNAIPTAFALSAYPNPFNPRTTISLSLPEASDVRVNVFDIAGRYVQTLGVSHYEAGTHSLTFDAGALPAGVYFVRAQAGSLTRTEKLLLLK
jgi:hypothetical protein